MELGIDPLYRTEGGSAYLGDSLELLRHVPDEYIDLVLTSPPFALQRPKEYGNPTQEEYVEWFLPFGEQIKRILKETGSFVLDIRGAFKKGRPVKSVYQYRLLLRLLDEQGWILSQDLTWYNPATLASPLEWCNKRKIRLKEATNNQFWLSRVDFPKADVRRVLQPYGADMRKQIENPRSYRKYPSGHEIRPQMDVDRGGAIPSNCLRMAGTPSSMPYLRMCRMLGAKHHPARFPRKIPEFWVNFLTEEGDLVLDVFAGSNVVGMVSEELGRSWMAFERVQQYLAASAFRFVDYEEDTEALRRLYGALMREGARDILVEKRQGKLPPDLVATVDRPFVRALEQPEPAADRSVQQLLSFSATCQEGIE